MSVEVSMPLLDDYEKSALVQDLVELKPWMKKCQFTLIKTERELSDFVDAAIEKGLVAIDTESTGLNLRADKVNGGTISKIVGWCLAHDVDHGYYVPVRHHDYDDNLPVKVVNKHITRLLAGAKAVYHRFKYDGEIMRGEGIIQEDPEAWEDTQLLHYTVHPEMEKRRGLKECAETFLGRPMIEISDLTPGKSKVVDFAIVPPQVAVYYAASDAMNTLGLYYNFMEKLQAMDPDGNGKTPGPKFTYITEKRNMIAVMEMERNQVLIDVDYYRGERGRLYEQLNMLEERVYELAGCRFQVNSGPQLAKLLFEDMKIRYPLPLPEGSGYSTKEEVLSLIKGKGQDLVQAILKYRGFYKIVSTYLENFLNNHDENNEIKIAFHPERAATGRFSSGGGELHKDGYSGINGQNIPSNYDPEAVDMRKGVIARPGYTIVTIDYSGEELRIATNLSKEPMWLDEFLNGSADLHTVTASVIYKQPPGMVTKLQRSVAKTLNFLSLYGGGARGFSQQAGIPLEEAAVALDNFNTGLVGLADWKNRERGRCKRRGYSLTAFGRRRSLKELYESDDRVKIAAADRHAINSAIQGCLQYKTMVLTDMFGYISIGKLYDMQVDSQQSLDDVKVWNGNRWCSFVVFNRGEWDLANLTLSNGLHLDCDTRHEVLIATDSGYEFKHYSDLGADTQICASVPTLKKFGSFPEDMTFSGGIAHNSADIEVKCWDEMAWLAGVVTGDGNVYADKGTTTLSFGKVKVDKLLPRINSLLVSIGLGCVSEKPSTGSIGESYTVDIHSKALIDALVYLGVVPGSTSHTKRVPAYIFSAPSSMRTEYLRGYWDTDGCKMHANRYGFHTPNMELLQDVQKIAWTLGLECNIHPYPESGTYKLEWQDPTQFEKFMGLPITKRSRRTSSRMILPKFKAKEVYDLLCGHSPKMDSRDRSLLCKLNKGGNVTVHTAIALLDRYGVERPEMYYHYKLRGKKDLGYKEDTYTLSVFDENDSHRFDSEGIISKNTGADIMKITMWRVWKLIRDNGWGDYVKMILTIHDEIVYEMRTDLLDLLIPAVSDVMRMSNLTKALKWPVGLEVDAEYGTSFHVDHNYFEEVAKGIRKPATTVEEALANYQEYLAYLANNEKPKEKEAPVAEEQDSSENLDAFGSDEYNEEYSGEAIANHEQPERKIVDENYVGMQDNPLKNDYLSYTVMKTDKVAKTQADSIWATLDTMEQYASGPKKAIRLISNDGKKRILYTTTKRYPVDGFLAMATFLSI